MSRAFNSFREESLLTAARLRCQVSAAHERRGLDRAVQAFRKVGKRFSVVGSSLSD